ncbi:MAG: class II aldolase/adducin family protein, partial [Solirubrobacteraceae bacterium]
MELSIEAAREQVAAASRRLAAERLVHGGAGNVSVRAGERVAVTPTGSVLRDLDVADV